MYIETQQVFNAKLTLWNNLMSWGQRGTESSFVLADRQFEHRNVKIVVSRIAREKLKGLAG